MTLRERSPEEVFCALLGYKYIFMSQTKDIDKNVETCPFQKMQEVMKKLGPRRDGSTISTTRWLTDSFSEICSALAKFAEASDALYGGMNCLLTNQREKPLLDFANTEVCKKKRVLCYFL